MLTKNANRSLMDWEPISERFLRAWFHSKFQKVSIIQCYAPTNTADQKVKEHLCEQLQSLIERTPNRDITIVLGEFNAKVGNDNTTRESITERCLQISVKRTT